VTWSPQKGDAAAKEEKGIAHRLLPIRIRISQSRYRKGKNPHNRMNLSKKKRKKDHEMPPAREGGPFSRDSGVRKTGGGLMGGPQEEARSREESSMACLKGQSLDRGIAKRVISPLCSEGKKEPENSVAEGYFFFRWRKRADR